MLTVLRPKSQITIPSNIISSLGLKEGDQLDICEDHGAIRLIPVAVYPKEYIKQLHTEISQLKEDIQNGKHPVFNNLDSLFADLDADTEE
ncbi:MAG: AbrB/MazE/SpoVT family DNA-binding domain-containing protein [Lachnospiraceae bacterium]|nr:AbrB/MazE/SpoVT family DNA-binding domain-containing protein [Lachnospiraceae bacterium]